MLYDLKQTITINVAGASAGDRAATSRSGRVSGQLVDADGAALANHKISVFVQELRAETHIADVQSEADGSYSVSYARKAALHLFARAYDGTGKSIAQSAVVFSAPAVIAIDLTTASDGVVRSPSRFTSLSAQIVTALGTTPLAELKEDSAHHELRFLASSIGAPFADVAYLFLARVLATSHKLRDDALYGIFCQGIPASLDAALATLPEAGLDAAFQTQVLSAVLGHARGALQQTLLASVAANLIPATFSSVADAQLDVIDSLRAQAVHAQPYVRGKTALAELLTAGNVSTNASAAFARAYADAAGRLGPTWKVLRADKTLTSDELAKLNTTLSVGELLAGNVPLVRDTVQRLANKTLTSVSDLALLDENDWIARIEQIDPSATSIPSVLPNDTVSLRIQRFAKALAQRFSGRYTTTALRGGLAKATASAFQTKAELVAVLAAHPTLELRHDNLDFYLATNKVALSAPALEELKTAQRLLRISPHYASVEALKHAGYASAQAVYFAGRAPFLATMTKPLGSAGMANMAYARAHMTYASALVLFAQFNQSLNGIRIAALATTSPSATSLASYPDLQALFGPLDYFECRECQSVYSPAAYLVDLLQYLAQFAVTPLDGASAPIATFTNARDAVLFRRPELQYIALDCSNTDTTLPYIDLVNEILEAFIAPPSPPPTPPIIVETTGTSAERRALPQAIDQAAYVATKAAAFPLGLPFDLPFAQTTSYLTSTGITRDAILALFAGPSGPSAAAIACAALGINSSMQAVINGTDAHPLWERWGFASQNPTDVIDPKTRATFTPTDYVAALSKVPVLLQRGALTLQELYQLLEAAWVTDSAVALQLGTTNGLVSADTELMTFTGLTGDVLDRAQRFLRLWEASGLAMWELDWALDQAAGTVLDDAFLVLLEGAIAIARQLKLPLQDVLSFWGSLETRDVTNHLGDADSVQPSAYSAAFANPTMLASWASVFPPVSSQPPGSFALAGTPIVPPQQNPTPAQSANVNATVAALGISGDDIAAILAGTTPVTPNTLTLATINVLLRFARLASALSLPIPELLLWIQLTGGTPFGTTPADTREFLRRLAVLRGLGLTAHDLDYLLRDGSTAQSVFAFTSAQTATLLQSIRDAIVKLTPAQQTDPATVATIVVAAAAAAIGVAANVVTPLLATTGVLPLSTATVAQLLAATTVDPAQFPQLTAAVLSVARGAALSTAIGATDTELAFVVQHAATFGWLDPSAMPSGPTSPYTAFEALLYTIRLDKRQPARAPKLFDVLGAWLVAGHLPPDLATAIAGTANVPALADALDATAADVSAIAAALGAKAPGITTATQPGSLCDMQVLAAIGAALDVVSRYNIRGTSLVLLSTATPDTGTAASAAGAFQTQYPQSAWFGAVQPVEDDLRERRRDALVAYLLGPGQTLAPMFSFVTTDDVFDYFLIDPEMCACASTTRLLQASLAIQQFVQQAFLGLQIQVAVDTTGKAWSEWSWRQQFRLWQANREVFLYPENYLLPELRKDASPFFVDLENDLRQTTCDADLAETALENYLRKLVDVSHLVVAAHYNQTMADGSVVLHVFARTRTTPYKWSYRARTKSSATAAGVWDAWQSLDLDIPSEQIVPVVWDQRLHLVWPLFKPESEKQRDQDVPDASGGGTQSAPTKYWAVDFGMSELSAGVWQPKVVLAEKMFFQKTVPGVPVDWLDRPPYAFTFRATESPAHDLVIEAYYNLDWIELFGEIANDHVVTTPLVATGTLSMPEAPMRVVQSIAPTQHLLPDASLVDVSQEPSYALVTSGTLTGSLTGPANFNFRGQDLVPGYWFRPELGQTVLSVLAQATASGPPTTVQLLGTVVNPRIVVPQQEPVFDSLDPFFVSDGGGGTGSSPRPNRTYLVEPSFFTVSSSPQEIENLYGVSKWTTEFSFETVYHPYARTMLRELEIGGVPRLMARTFQTDPQSVRGWPAFNFQTIFAPRPPVATPYPGQPSSIDVGESALDFAPGSTGAYSLYNWELLFHAPMFVASLLSQNQQYADAMSWLNYIFDPADSSGGATPQRFWQTAPFHALNAADWTGQQIQNILSALAEGITDPVTSATLARWMADPFDPHAIASLRISAYGKSTVMKFLDNLIAWADSLFAIYNAETVGRAEQLYILADLILGPEPDEVRMPPVGGSQPLTYAQIESQLDTFSNTLVTVENLVVAPTPPQALIQGTDTLPQLPQLPGSGKTLFFCIPPNDQLLAYWTTVADRLYKIRHCLNLQGQAVPLPLYAPAINPLLLTQTGAAGQVPSGLGPTTPIYRFATYVGKAIELANDVRAFGALILSALEKKDAERLALLRANQEVDIQNQMVAIKSLQVTEASEQITALRNQKAVSKIRYDFYSTIQLMNAWETQALELQGRAQLTNGLAIPLDRDAALTNLIPSFSFGANGFGGTPEVTTSWGGGNLAGAANAAASALRGAAGILSGLGSMVATLGQYQRRQDEWQLQASIASAEMTQIDSQISAATDRLQIAQSELSMQTSVYTNAEAVKGFLANKYTQAQLYDWMVSQLTTVHAQAYQLAYGLAQQAQSAYQYELGRYTDTFIQFGYWDSQHRGLTAGESLLFDLRRMEAQYLAQNARELELTKHISLAMTQPLALVQLIETGTCQIKLDESLFDLDHPGHYFRRLRSVAVTVPCVTGPYTGVNANLTLASAVVRVTSTLPAGGYVPTSAQPPPTDMATFSVSAPGAAIATSTGQNDTGLFETNLRDERWLPFEGQGAVSAWTLELNPQANNFDFSTITDVILHVRYTARAGIAEQTVVAAITPTTGISRSLLVSAKSTFADALYSFFHPTDTTATQQLLTLPITQAVFPFTNFGAPKIASITVFFALASAPASGTSVATTFGPTGNASPALALTNALPAGWTGNPAILAGTASLSPASAPQSFALTLPATSVPAALGVTVGGVVRLDPAKVDDVVLVINYTT
ncbi:MAG: neuraminidase-like domain-containing protein [Deltaproteobacteria bacterium]